MSEADDQLGATFDSLLTFPTPQGQPRPTDLWSLLPRELAALFRPGVPELAEEILREIQRAIPALARRTDGAFSRSIISGIQQAILQFVDRLADPANPQDDRAQVFRELGVHDLRDGPILDTLQMAYRVGARVAWRRMARTATRARVPPATLCLLAEALFAYIDELSALSIEGHACAHAREIGALERRRHQLLEAILTPGSSPTILNGLAESARWPVPERIILVALESRDHAGAPTPALDQRILVGLEGSSPYLLMPAGEGALVNQLTAHLPGWRAAAGPAVALTEARTSLRWARRTIALVQRGVLPDCPLTWFTDHLSTLWLLSDPFLVKEISERALAPLAGLTATQRAKLSETLLAWLETRRSAAELATILEIHPQTVRYRLRQLEKLFGARLEDPDARFALEVALRAARYHGWSRS